MLRILRWSRSWMLRLPTRPSAAEISWSASRDAFNAASASSPSHSLMHCDCRMDYRLCRRQMAHALLACETAWRSRWRASARSFPAMRRPACCRSLRKSRTKLKHSKRPLKILRMMRSARCLIRRRDLRSLAARPIPCRTFGPPVKNAEGGLGVCELCFHGATTEEIAACEMHPDPEQMEERLLDELRVKTGAHGQTIVTYALRG